MFSQTFKNIDNALREEAGCSSELDYTEQSSWILFLKYLDDLEKEREEEALLRGEPYTPLIEAPYRWTRWAVPKKDDGSLDRDKALTGDDLIRFVNEELFPYLKDFKHRAAHVETIAYKIGEIFSEIKNKFNSGYSLRDVLELTDTLSFGSQEQKHELSVLYEDKIKRMGNAGRNGGEYYTPRPLIRAMIALMAPKIGETIYDGAVGSAGFLCEAFRTLRPQAQTTSDLETLQQKTFYGVEKKSLAYIIATMNMILHGVDAPCLRHDNTLARALADIQPSDQVDIILANPPFGGKERAEIQHNFPIRTSETAYLFLQHFMKMLKPGGRAAIVIKNTFLSNGDATALRKDLLESCNLHTILDCPQGTFLGAGVKTVLLFFEKGAPTQEIWFYQLTPDRTLGKTSALTDADFEEFLHLAPQRAHTPKSWTLAVQDLGDTCDLSVKNPNQQHKEEKPLCVEEVIHELVALDQKSTALLQRLQDML
ncbi:MAG: N-6 DNA methylase [Acetobacter sp.]|nr:N-6 DNA methylase [Acetobacter sp.]